MNKIERARELVRLIDDSSAIPDGVEVGEVYPEEFREIYAALDETEALRDERDRLREALQRADDALATVQREIAPWALASIQMTRDHIRPLLETDHE